jgi:small nuclear ribonucleoprotein (snRNP)-like protein
MYLHFVGSVVMKLTVALWNQFSGQSVTIQGQSGDMYPATLVSFERCLRVILY